MSTFTEIRGYWQFGVVSSLALGVAIAFSSNCAHAQITPDNTLGGENSVVTPNIIIKGLPAERIDGGAIRGAHLFHSFTQFNVGSGQRVYFANPVGIENILSRVTGTDPSDILGTLGVDGTANLFLLNPNGIIFGSNSSLDIRGSFLGSTADSLVFGNGSQFSATNPDTPPLLTINVPIGLQYGPNHPGATIANQGNLAVGEDLTLAAGNLDLQGQLQAGRDLTLQAQDAVKIRDSTVEPFIAAARGKLLVQGNQEVDIFALNHPDSGLFSGGDMVLRSANAVGGDAHYWTGGSFRIEQLDGNLGNLFSPYDPIIRASGDVSFVSYTGASLHILAGGSVTIPGFVIITNPETTGILNTDYLEEEITLSNGEPWRINGMSEPTLDIRAGTTAFDPPGITGNTDGFIPFPPPTGGTGTSADITIGTIAFIGGINIPNDLLAGRVLLTNKYQPNPLLAGGDIEVSATLGLFPNVAIQTGGIAGGGMVAIDSRGSITLNGIVNTSAIPVANDFAGNGGNVSVLADGEITLAPGASIISAGLLGGQITLDSGGTLLIDDGAIFSLTTGAGKGGNITVNASDGVEILNNTGLASTNLAGLLDSLGLDGTDLATAIRQFSGTGLGTTTTGAGDSGDITVNTSRLIIRNNQRDLDTLTGVSTASLPGSSGNGGKIEINASDLVEIVGNRPGPFSAGLSDQTAIIVLGIPTGITTATNGSGDAGNLGIDTGRLIIRDGAGATSGKGLVGTGEGGSLRVSATESIELQGLAAVATGSLGPGNAGELIVEAPTAQVTLRDGAGISTDTLGFGDAATLSINAAELTILDGSRIGAATTAEGSGATININADLVEVAGTNADGTVQSGLFTSAIPGSTGAAGDLNIDARILVVRDGGRVSASTASAKGGGILNLNASEAVEVIGTSADSQISSSLFFDSSGAGDAGRLNITTERLTVRDGGRVSASTSDAGRGGTLDVNASEAVEVIGTSANGQISSSLFFDSSGAGDAGDLRITTQRLSVRDGGEVSASTSGDGNAGTLELNASESVEVIGASADGSTPSRLFFDSSGAGDAGELAIATRRLVVRDGGQVSAATSATGRGGILEVNASESIEVSGSSGSFASGLFFDSRGAGDARGIKIDTGNLVVANRGQITVSGTGTGTSGDLEIKADSIFLNNQGLLRAATAASEGGNIRLQVADSIIMRHNSEISAEAFGTAKGGNITMEVGNFIIALLSENSDIVASAFQGQGGNISAQATGIFGFRQFQGFRTPESDFTATSELGIDGTVEVITRDDLRLEDLSDDFLNDKDQPTQGCQAFGSRSSAQFYNTGRGGLPTNPYEPLGSDDILEDVQPPTQGSENPAEPDTSLMTSPDKIVEAQGWIITDKGEVRLVAQMPVTLSQNPCHLR